MQTEILARLLLVIDKITIRVEALDPKKRNFCAMGHTRHAYRLTECASKSYSMNVWYMLPHVGYRMMTPRVFFYITHTNTSHNYTDYFQKCFIIHFSFFFLFFPRLLLFGLLLPFPPSLRHNQKTKNKIYN